MTKCGAFAEAGLYLGRTVHPFLNGGLVLGGYRQPASTCVFVGRLKGGPSHECVRSFPSEGTEWVGRLLDTEIAKVKMTEAAGILPGEYFILDQKTGREASRVEILRSASGLTRGYAVREDTVIRV